MNSPILNEKSIGDLRSKLEKEKNNLEKELARIAEKNPEVEGDWKATYADIGDDKDENAQEVAEYDTRLGLERTLEGRLKKVSGALSRIEKGEYGYCQVDGEPIPLERLEANPATAVCLDHAE